MSGIKEAYTTRELAELKGVAPKNLLSRAKRENWTVAPAPVVAAASSGLSLPCLKRPGLPLPTR